MKTSIKTKSILSGIFIMCLALTISCSKSKSKVYPEENPLALYLKLSGFDQKSENYINSGVYEFGYNFKPKVKGKINAVTFKIPSDATNIRVTIWDVATKFPLKTFTISSVVANKEITQKIDPFAVTAGTNYLLSYKGAHWYRRSKSSNSDAIYPIEAGNIWITGYSWGATTLNEYIYPQQTMSKNYYAGDLSIVFQPTE